MSERFNELLPWYVNGTLLAEDHAWVEHYLREHPAARSQLAFFESLKQRLHEDAPLVSDEIGLDKAMARIHALGRIAPVRAPAPQPSLLQRLRGLIGSIGLTPALGGALAVVVLQVAVIGTLMHEWPDTATQVRAVPPTSTDRSVFVKVNFKPDAREADIRLLLVQAQGSLAAGPGQLGDYYVRVAPERRAQVLALLQASPIVDAAAPIDGLPARE